MWPKARIRSRNSACVLNYVQLFVTPWTGAHQAPVSTGLSWQEYWSGLLFPPSGYTADPGIELLSSAAPTAKQNFETSLPGFIYQIPPYLVNNYFGKHGYQIIHCFLGSIRGIQLFLYHWPENGSLSGKMVYHKKPWQLLSQTTSYYTLLSNSNFFKRTTNTHKFLLHQLLTFQPTTI